MKQKICKSDAKRVQEGAVISDDAGLQSAYASKLFLNSLYGKFALYESHEPIKKLKPPAGVK